MALCSYGCGKEAIYQFKNGKWCCSKNISGCRAINKKQKEGNVGKIFSIERKRNISNSLKGRKLTDEHKKKVSEGNKGKIISETTRKKISVANTGKKRSKQFKLNVGEQKRITINQIKKRYPFFSKLEEMRYNPDKPGEKEIQVHCKNHNCPNSKEQGGWFTPTGHQFDGRRRALEDKEGNGGSYFYCCQQCRNECPLFNLNAYREIQKENRIETQYTEYEYQQFRQFVLERDNYKCQYCGKKAEHVHHERPQKLEPFFALDPDLAWSVCKKCHYKYGHGDYCKTNIIAKKVCN
jgi:hypothetical protein